MSHRTIHLLGLLIALLAVAIDTAQAADSLPMQWSSGAGAAASGSAEEAAQLARQAAQLAARAAEMAAAAQQPAATRLAVASSTAFAASKTPASVAGSVVAPLPYPDVQQPNIEEIRFQNSPTTIATDSASTPSAGGLPRIVLPAQAAAAPIATVVPAVAATPVPLVAAAPAPYTVHDDGQVHLAANTFLEAEFLQSPTEEPLPTAGGANHPTPLAPNSYDTGCATCDTGCCARSACCIGRAAWKLRF